MKFNKNQNWYLESDEDIELLADDDLDTVEDEEQINEVRYIDPDNVSNYDPSEIEKVKDAQGNDRYRRKSGKTNATSKQTNTASKSRKHNLSRQQLEKGKNYTSNIDINYGPIEDFEDIAEPGDIEKLKQAGFVKNGEILIPAGTEFTYNGSMGGGDNIDVAGVNFDMYFDDDEFTFEPSDDSSNSSKDSDKNTKSTADIPEDIANTKTSVDSDVLKDLKSSWDWNNSNTPDNATKDSYMRYVDTYIHNTLANAYREYPWLRGDKASKDITDAVMNLVEQTATKYGANAEDISNLKDKVSKKVNSTFEDPYTKIADNEYKDVDQSTFISKKDFVNALNDVASKYQHSHDKSQAYKNAINELMEKYPANLLRAYYSTTNIEAKNAYKELDSAARAQAMSTIDKLADSSTTEELYAYYNKLKDTAKASNDKFFKTKKLADKIEAHKNIELADALKHRLLKQETPASTSNIVDYSGDLRNIENWPKSIEGILDYERKLRLALNDQYNDATGDDKEKFDQQYHQVFDDAEKAMAATSDEERFKAIDNYYKSRDYITDFDGYKTKLVQLLFKYSGYDVSSKRDMRQAYKDLQSKLNNN